MGYLSRYDGTETVDLEDGYWVQVKKCLSGDEEAQCQKNTLSWKAEQDKSGNWRAVISKVDPTALDREYALASLVAWNIDDADGNVLSLASEADRRANYGMLARRDQEKIEGVVSRLNAAPTTVETRTFPAGGEGSSSNGEVERPDDRQVRAGKGVVGAAGNPPRSAANRRKAVEGGARIPVDNERVGGPRTAPGTVSA